MKKLITIICTLFLFNSVLAQTKKIQEDTTTIKLTDGCFVLFSGLGKPIGDYGSTNINNQNAGFAKPGVNLEASYSTNFTKHIGFAAMFRSVTNQFNSKSLENSANQIDPYYSYSITAKPWKLKTAMAGIYSSFAFTKSKKATVYAKALFGASFATCNEIDYTITPKQHAAYVANGGFILFQSPASTSNALAYLFGVGFKYNISWLLSILVQVDYSSTSPQFQASSTASNAYYTVNDPQNPFTQKMQTLNFNIGLGIKIN